jgi:prepilin-type N-terminal cleavage/methylation domain-containing protein
MKTKAFILIELLVVVAIIGILAAVDNKTMQDSAIVSVD